MENQLQESWNQLRDTVSASQNVSALSLAVYLLMGGFISIYVRVLYRFCSTAASESDSITRVFPMLTLVTIGVIAVVKSSMALSLGLVGALSIVRFRAAIKEPEELVYLFLCIGVGLALGASQPLLAIVLVVVATFFSLLLYFTNRQKRELSLMLTITGDSQRDFHQRDDGVMPVLSQIAGNFTLQRMDLDGKRGQVRVVLRRTEAKNVADLIGRLRDKLPECEFSYVNLQSL